LYESAKNTDFVTDVLIQANKVLAVIVERDNVGDVLVSTGRICWKLGVYVGNVGLCVLAEAGGVDLAGGG
jgi:hypothetical protein